MRMLLCRLAPALALLTGCAAQPSDDLPPLTEVEQDSLTTERVQAMAPPEVGPAARNPDDPFLLATIDADQRVTGIFAGGVAARDPRMPECAAALQRAQAAGLAVVAPPDPCVGVDLRVQGAGAAGVVFPPPPEPTPGVDETQEDEGSWVDKVFSIFG